YSDTDKKLFSGLCDFLNTGYSVQGIWKTILDKITSLLPLSLFPLDIEVYRAELDNLREIYKSTNILDFFFECLLNRFLYACEEWRVFIFSDYINLNYSYTIVFQSGKDYDLLYTYLLKGLKKRIERTDIP